MSDEYIAQLIVDELERLCQGNASCHGCQSWCPKCGTVDHVCDDPECDTHRRDTDVERDLVDARSMVTSAAKKCNRLEQELLPQRLQGMDDVRRALRSAISDFSYAERQVLDLEEELREVTGPGSKLVPRRPESKRVPRDR